MEISVPVQKATVVPKPFIRLMRLLARTLYDDNNLTTLSDNQKKSAKGDSRGNIVMVLDALMRFVCHLFTFYLYGHKVYYVKLNCHNGLFIYGISFVLCPARRQWVREEDLASDLKKNSKQVRKILRHFEEEHLVTRYQRKETAKRAKIYNVAVAATAHGRAEDNKFHTHSYCCLDYQHMYDTARLRLQKIKRKLKDELEDKYTLQKYGCPNCNRKYSALDALRLISMEDDAFHCERCNGVLVVECDKLSSKEVVDGGDNVKRRQRQRLQFAEALMDQINRVKDIPFPVYESFPEWEARAAMDARENGDFNTNDPFGSQGVNGSTPMPYLGETKVEVNLRDGKEDGVPSGKPMPQWMIRQGMNLTKEQRGEMSQEEKVGGVSEGEVLLSDDYKPSAMGNDNDTYLKETYYAALLQQLEAAQKMNQQESTPDIQSATTCSDRQVGMKSKREDYEDAECEEGAHVSANGADVEEEEEDDGVEWEEG
ncbi:transcription initiation factor IIE subunit alpha isoform X1 [Brassica rapa]|uniref:transcription initiation factor IIE subunit alpha isoform X1 n=1 Tax=Brassica campestris TaxID=3711 RepID=UPI00142DA976|nr:transcription initiation factor IIE subunit alpha isoform X1 [Brassica rapa]XP_033129255.1 transcription initiation factor IIE subunit alpha isoform X1 [Brassica rapa]XP_033129256.1 transcription initiation factor IIE subunit alpha isoform X1 [Brassica rapa]